MKMLKMNLQYFAEEKEVIDTDEIVDDQQQEEQQEEQPTEDKPTEEQPEEEQQQEEQQEEEQPKMVPLSALEKERDKWKNRLKETEKYKSTVEKLAKYSGLDEDALAQQIEQIQVQQYTNQGIDPQMAQAFVQQQSKLSQYEQSLKKQQRDMEVTQLKDNPMYSDIETYRDELEDYADQKGVSLKEAYFAVRGEDVFSSRMTEMEQRILNNLQNKQKAKVDTSANGGEKSKPKVQLSSDELEVAKMAGMTPKEYHEMKNS